MKIRTWCLETIPIRIYSTSSHSNLVNRTYCPKPVVFVEFYRICCMARSLRSLRQVATLRHGHMARRSASLLYSGH